MRRTFIIAAISMGLLWSCGDQSGEPSSDSSLETPSGESRNLDKDSHKTSFLRKKLDVGIDFYAIGNEPSWNLDFDVDEYMHFQAPGKIEMHHPATVGEEKGNTMRYTSKTEMGKMEVVLKMEKCMDSMSGETFDYSVEVTVTTGVDESSTYKGCGTFLRDFRLHDTWVLEVLEGDTLKPQNFDGDLPQMEIFVEEGRIAGNDGCNDFSGEAETRGNTLRIGQLQQTRKMCENMEYPNRISG
ncbi:MAG TPA: META domain-containing protein, partial [Cryomorphaceae bacterium]|nr:META domain-containing protein [Cryomorphaceae bacterium]